MARNMSFALTTDQIRNRTKTVTRRLGWKFLKAGDLIQAVVKCMGLNRGEPVVKLALLRVVSVRREPLQRMIDEIEYGLAETTAEGFPAGHPKHFPSVFVGMFCDAMGCYPSDLVTRIEFAYE